MIGKLALILIKSPLFFLIVVVQSVFGLWVLHQISIQHLADAILKPLLIVLLSAYISWKHPTGFSIDSGGLADRVKSSKFVWFWVGLLLLAAVGNGALERYTFPLTQGAWSVLSDLVQFMATVFSLALPVIAGMLTVSRLRKDK